MTATNHTLTGIVIVAVVPNPLLGVVLAFLSHFALDALPHLGQLGWGHSDKRFLILLAVDCSFALSVLVLLAIAQPSSWPWLIAGGIAGASPDLMWFSHWLRSMRHKKSRSLNVIERFHSNLQWGERPWGWLIEIPYGLLMSTILINLV